MNDSSPGSRRWLPLVGWVVVAIVLMVLPQGLSEYWTGAITKWMPFAIGALGLNLLTGYNGQISVGHGALYGVGAYTGALVINNWGWPFPLAVLAAGVVCFGVGVIVGLPALRIKGLYLALVTLSVATLFPQLLEQWSSFTGGSSGLSVTSDQLYRGRIRPRPFRFEAPEWSGLANDQWTYYLFLAITVVCFVLVRNIVASRPGRAMVAIRDNEVAAEVSGVNVAAVKVFVFGISSALAGVGGALLAVYDARVSSGSFTLAVSLYFLVAVVIGGPASIVGPVLGTIAYKVFDELIKPELGESWQPASPLVLGVLLVVLMLVAPGGMVGLSRQLGARLSAGRRLAVAGSSDGIEAQPDSARQQEDT